MPRTYTERLHPRGHGGKWVKKGLGGLGSGGDDDSPAPGGRKPAEKRAGQRGGESTGRARRKAPTAEQSKKFLNDHYGDWKKNLTPAQDKAMRFYQSPGFALMNGQLRGQAADGLKKSERATDTDLARARKASKDLTAAIRTAPPLKEPVTVYRGFSADQFGNLEAGATITDKGFVSTSLTDDAGAVGKASRKATAEITLPAGTRAAAGSARELVLPPGAKFRVTKVTSRGGNPHVTMEYVPPAGKRGAVTAAASLELERDALLAELNDDEDRLAELLVDLYADEIDFHNLGDSDGELTADAVPFSRMPPQLQKSYLTGKVAKRIKWRKTGDWRRCRAQALKHGMTPHQAAGACQYLHKLATGVYTGDRRNV